MLFGPKTDDDYDESEKEKENHDICCLLGEDGMKGLTVGRRP